VLQAGNLIQYDTPDGIYNRPAAKFVAGFTGSPPMNFAPCRIGEGGRTLHIAGALDLPVPARCVAECARHIGREVTFGLRPEHIGVATAGASGSERVDGQVLLVEPLGAETLGLIKLGRQDDAVEMTGRFEPDARLRAGQDLPVALDLNHLHLFDSKTGLAIRGLNW
jgi:multiple sugar transport system ATP-binding protein